MKDEEMYMDFILKTISEILELDPGDINIGENFTTMGFKSTDALRILQIIKNEFNIDANPAILFEYPNVKSLAVYLSKNAQ